ncbi:MAG: mRNA splicing protein [Vezdaea aestivalis]|nr:MAG: mRNA splicing protein [Vezdaea aestivalis]
MASIASSLSNSLPKPKHSFNDETPAHAKPRGPRIVSANDLDQTQVVLRRSGPPPYGKRETWRPRVPEDYGDGGAFPELPVAQYPLDMGRKDASSSNALAIQVDSKGQVQYDAIARRGHSDDRIIHASFKDLIPLRQRADVGEINLSRPSDEEVAASTEKTKAALAVIVAGAVTAQKPKNVKGATKIDPTYVRYTPAAQMGDNTRKNDRIMKIVARQHDPLEPPKFKHKKIPRGPPSPPAPVMRSPPRKLTAEDQEAWRIPPPISNWKNPKGFTVPLDKRLAADGRGLQDVTINDKFAPFTEALALADRAAREQVQQRALMQQRLAEKEKANKEDNLRALAQKAREERTSHTRRRSPSTSPDRNGRTRRRRSSSASTYSSRSSSADSAAREREQMRRDKKQEAERQLRQSRMGAERKMQVLAREQNRDISERVALGLARPSAPTGEAQYDSRLFGQTSAWNMGFNEDQHYDKPLFAARDAIEGIYRPGAGGGLGDDEEADEESAQREMDGIQRKGRFEALGKPKSGFKGASDAEPRTGPVQFEAAEKKGESIGEKKDDFGVDAFLAQIDRKQGGKKRYGLDEGEGRAGKKARVEDDD